MPLSMRSTEVQGVTVLNFSGAITSGISLTTFLKIVRQAIRPKAKIVVGLNLVEYMDSPSVRSLREVKEHAEREGVPCALTRPGSRVEAMLQLHNIDAVIPIFENPTEAVANL
jgi:anti-anti-sigma factor